MTVKVDLGTFGVVTFLVVGYVSVSALIKVVKKVYGKGAKILGIDDAKQK